ncbi:MAG: hypothetical protein PV344_00245, partial [Anaplasma sp.]|nr:hypothetical protein [Anaplasma sp.]
ETKMKSDNDIAVALRPFLSHYEVCVSHAVGFSAGCFLFLKKSVNLSNLHVTTDDRGRFILCDFNLSSVQWRVICVYAPNNAGDREQFFQFLRSYLDCDRAVVLMGDFNCVCDERDKSSQSVISDSSVSVLKDMIDSCGLDDVGASCAPTHCLRYTHFQVSSHARLDRIYLSCDMLQQAHDYSVQPVFFSDHCLVTFKVGKKESAASKFDWDLWKINRTLLKDEHFIGAVTGLLRDASATDGELGEAWEIFKEEVKSAAIERSSNIQFQRREREKQLKRNLEALHRLETQNPGTCMEDIRNIKTELDKLYQEKYRGAVIRSRSEKYLLGEQPTKRALSDEKKYALSKEIREIDFNGTTSNDRKTIQQCFVDYYDKLFGERPTPKGFPKLDDFLTLMPQLSGEVKTWLEGDITVGEIEQVIDSLARQKTPGPDGLCAEFYQCFKKSISPLLLSVFQEAYKIHRLPSSFSEAHTIFIPKSDDEVKRRSVTGYRPISLCNT